MKITNSYMKIANNHIGTIYRNVRIANWYENCKLIRKFQTLIWELQSNSHVSVKSSCVDMCNFHMRHSGNENLFWNRKNASVWLRCVDDENSKKQSLAKPSTIYILIPIPMLTQSNSYFKPWFLFSLFCFCERSFQIWTRQTLGPDSFLFYLLCRK